MNPRQETYAPPVDDGAAALRGLAPFAGASLTPLQRLDTAAEWRRVARGQAFQMDENSVLACAAGQVRLIAGSRYFDIEAGQICFLEEAVAGRATPHCAGAALYESLFAVIPAAAIAAEMAPGRALAASLAQYFAGRLAGGRREEVSGPAQKLYARLAMLAQPNGADGFWKIGRMPRHRELADHAGLTEEDAANAVAHLISTGVARRHYPGLEIIDYPSLQRLAAG